MSEATEISNTVSAINEETASQGQDELSPLPEVDFKQRVFFNLYTSLILYF
jgi:hypothetical protein